MFEFYSGSATIQLLSGYARMTCALEPNISGIVNVAMPISLVGLSRV